MWDGAETRFTTGGKASIISKKQSWHLRWWPRLFCFLKMKFIKEQAEGSKSKCNPLPVLCSSVLSIDTREGELY